MKRNLLYLIACAASTLLVCGCGNDLMDGGNEKPAPLPTPDAKDRVTLHASVSNPDYPDGPDFTRAEPRVITQELGDGYVMESTFTPAPRTRAATPLRQGSTIMMFALDSDGKAMGCELLEVGANGALAIELPADTVIPKLMFYTQDDEVRFTDAMFTGAAQLMPQDFEAGKYYAFEAPATLSDEVDLSDLKGMDSESFTMNECMVTALKDVDTSSSEPLSLTFGHVLTRFVWTVMVDSSISEKVGSLSAGIAPRADDGKMLFGSYASSTDNNATLYAFQNPVSDVPVATDAFMTSAAWPGTSATLIDTICILPSETAATARIHLTELTIKNNSGDITYKDKYINLSGGSFAGSFSPNTQYNLTTKITKRLTWAASNIYYVGNAVSGRLTFDALEEDGGGYDGTTMASDISGGRSGVVFKWGSLVAFAPQTAKTATTYYLPGGVEGDVLGDKTYIPHNTSGAADSIIWQQTYTPYTGEGNLPYPLVATGNLYHGDICAYITDGVWRMPFINEFAMPGWSGMKTVEGPETWWVLPDNYGISWVEWMAGDPPATVDGAGTFWGTNANKYVYFTSKWRRRYTFPRTVALRTTGEKVGTGGYAPEQIAIDCAGTLWSREPYGETGARQVIYGSLGGLQHTTYRTYGLAVRCVKTN